MKVQMSALLLFALALAACSSQQQDQTKQQVQQAVSAVPSPVKQGVTDAALVTAVEAAIAGQTGLNVVHVAPTVHNGVVTLKGTAPTAAIKETILETARKVHGVASVVDEIEIR